MSSSGRALAEQAVRQVCRRDRRGARCQRSQRRQRDRRGRARRRRAATRRVPHERRRARGRRLLEVDRAATSPRAGGRPDRGASAAAKRQDVGPALVERLPALTPGACGRGVLQVAARAADWTRRCSTAVEAGKLQLDRSVARSEAGAGRSSRRQRSPSGRRSCSASGGGLPNADRQKVIDELMPLCRQTGDAAARQGMSSRSSARSATCTRGEGTRIGPDLTGMAVHPKKELLVHILDPSRSVEGNFRVYTVADRRRPRAHRPAGSESKTADRTDRRRGEEARDPARGHRGTGRVDRSR